MTVGATARHTHRAGRGVASLMDAREVMPL